jgi:hypothetical protein
MGQLGVSEYQWNLRGLQNVMKFLPLGSTLTVDAHAVSLLIGSDGVDRCDGTYKTAARLSDEWDAAMERGECL